MRAACPVRGGGGSSGDVGERCDVLAAGVGEWCGWRDPFAAAHGAVPVACHARGEMCGPGSDGAVIQMIP
ncbi:hypothetical protein GCM10023335_35740 [Streptomyces siamensis]|uniref:Uncharacterized protein n=1 Tax=Streptomyces siamensis TaxID=1274986 RepID=A0ABP9IYJ3_9ACTN